MFTKKWAKRHIHANIPLFAVHLVRTFSACYRAVICLLHRMYCNLLAAALNLMEITFIYVPQYYTSPVVYFYVDILDMLFFITLIESHDFLPDKRFIFGNLCFNKENRKVWLIQIRWILYTNSPLINEYNIR